MQATKFEKRTFFLDVLEDVSFEGYSRGELWNGFECPYFPFENALQIVEALSVRQTAFYNELTDHFVFAQEGEEEDPELFGAIQIEGLGKLYAIGTCAWTWSLRDFTTNLEP